MSVIETIRHRAAICGHVTDAQSGAPIGGALVSLVQPPRDTRTRADGFYFFTDLEDGHYALQVSAPALGSRYGTAIAATVAVGSDGKGSPLLDPRGELALPSTRLSGTVSRSSDGTPVAFAQVLLPASGIRTLSDKVGHYQLGAIEAGAQRVQVTATGFTSFNGTVTLLAGQALANDIAMTPL